MSKYLHCPEKQGGSRSEEDTKPEIFQKQNLEDTVIRRTWELKVLVTLVTGKRRLNWARLGRVPKIQPWEQWEPRRGREPNATRSLISCLPCRLTPSFPPPEELFPHGKCGTNIPWGLSLRGHREERTDIAFFSNPNISGYNCNSFRCFPYTRHCAKKFVCIISFNTH